MNMSLPRVTKFILAYFALLHICWVTVAVEQLSAQDAAVEERDVNFAREIQPLLARRCFACHGPDKSEGGLRLHDSEKAFAKLDSGEFAIVPSKSDESALLARIAATAEDIRMPPEGKRLTEAEQSLLRRWIEQGAKWEKHWAFEPIGTPEVPAAINPIPGSTAVPSNHPIDRFIDDKLSKVGMSRNGRIEAASLLRRLYYDLTGLPPTIADIEEFEKAAQDNFEKAYEQQVDKLLASQQYGEKWARHWLDIVRFAETNSFERDGRKPHAWRYRDYVIRSFNSGKPYDQFLREQLAGDELPEVTKESLIATGFYRLGIWDDEPADRELAMYEGFDDIITTVGQGLLGLTMNCSRCHDHKIDPIPTHDYYSMLAFFRNVTPNGNGPQVERPLIANDDDREQFQLAETTNREKVNQLQAELTKLEQQLRSQMQDGEKDENRAYDLDDLEYRFYRDEFRELPNFDELKAETVAKLNPPLIDLKPATRPDNFGFVFTGTLIVPEDGEYTFILDSDDGSRLTIDGKMVIDHDGIHGEGRPKRTVIKLSQGRVPIRLDYFQGLFGKGLQLSWSGPSFKRRSLTAGETFNRQDFNQALNHAEAAGLDAEMVKQYRRVAKELEETKRAKPWQEYGMCVSESGTNAPDTFILTRGSPQGKTDKVEPSFLTILGSAKPEIVPNPKSNTSGRRLAFANWVTSVDNRLTSRVIVNRIWQHLFGRGIVRSPNNFGQLGDMPTHPELLDWLARDLIEKGWKLKDLQKMMVMSEAYRQSSVPSVDALKKDPNNDWFSHFNMRRLSAEEIRDSILATNGRLNLEMYGPGIFPEISREVLAGQSVPGSGWEQSSYEQQARRSVYIHVKRSLVVPFLSAFDFPDTDTSCEARFITVQPGQALSMLNGDYLNQQAAELAKRVRKEAGEAVKAQVESAIRLGLARKADEKEIDKGVQLIERLKAGHALNDEQALNYYCLFVYNLNEFIYLD